MGSAVRKAASPGREGGFKVEGVMEEKNGGRNSSSPAVSMSVSQTL